MCVTGCNGDERGCEGVCDEGVMLMEGAAKGCDGEGMMKGGGEETVSER